jgi:predicted O-methyltransferase YrrM
METRLDARRLRERLPELTGPPQEHDRLRISLLPLYRRFVACVAPPSSAMSLEVAGFLLDLCEQRQPRRILEVGTGFASAVLRQMGEPPGWLPEIWSADEDSARLARVRAFLAQEALPANRLLSWQDLSETAEGGFDLVVHELVPAARSILAGLLDRVTTGGLLLLDGAHCPVLERSARHVLDAAGAEHFSLRALTRDCFGRHALLALR